MVVGGECELGCGWSRKVWSEWYGQRKGAAACIRSGRCVGRWGLSVKLILCGRCALWGSWSVVTKLPWVKIWAMSPHLLVMPPRGDIPWFFKQTLDEGDLLHSGGGLGWMSTKNNWWQRRRAGDKLGTNINNPNPSPSATDKICYNGWVENWALVDSACAHRKIYWCPL